MAGIYIHIPFCKKACHYCNFHFSTSQNYKSEMISVLKKELILRQSEWESHSIESIYFGGGTPSVLNSDELQLILQMIDDHYTVEPHAEITLEANPDDLNLDTIKALAKTRINRLSIGIQTFLDNDLKDMNRVHSSKEAVDCVTQAKTYFDNITVDLMYGIPTMDDTQWRSNLEMVFNLGVNHLSCYALTVEPQTVLEFNIRNSKYPALDDNLALQHFETLVEMTAERGYLHYETCSFGKPGYFSKHNTNYWLGKPYLGIGPSAHSFDGNRRSWNISNNIKYIKAIEANIIPSEDECLTPENRFNEQLMTGLRTIWGVSLQQIEANFGVDFKTSLLQSAQKYIDNGSLFLEKDTLKTTSKGKFLSDGIASDLFIV